MCHIFNIYQMKFLVNDARLVFGEAAVPHVIPSNAAFQTYSSVANGRQPLSHQCTGKPPKQIQVQIRTHIHAFSPQQGESPGQDPAQLTSQTSWPEKKQLG